MGFSPLWSRPDWMICQVLPIAPPSVRPSVKHNAMLNKDDTMKRMIIIPLMLNLNGWMSKVLIIFRN